jgi:hypothetical protein
MWKMDVDVYEESPASFLREDGGKDYKFGLHHTTELKKRTKTVTALKDKILIILLCKQKKLQHYKGQRLRCR